MDKRCAETAIRLLHDLYSNSPLGYDHFSKKMGRYDKINAVDVKKIIEEFSERSKRPYHLLCEQLSLLKTIRVQDMEVLMEESSDRFLAHRFLKSLLFKYCLRPSTYGYEIMGGFRKFLKRERRVKR